MRLWERVVAGLFLTSIMMLGLVFTPEMVVGYGEGEASEEPSPTCYPSSASSLPPVTQWNRTYGGAGTDRAESGQQTSDGGYIVAGYTNSFGAGGWDFWLVKTDADGYKEWSKTYGGAGTDRAESGQQTSDGGYIVAGYTNSFGAGSEDFWLVKTDADGYKEWSKTYGGGSQDMAWAVQQTSDGGYIAAGNTLSFGAGNHDFWLVKTDGGGNMEWSKTYGGLRLDVAHSVQQTSDGGYMVAGYTESFGAGGYDFWLVKTDADGNMEWNKTYGGPRHDVEWSSQQTSDGGYIMTGFTGSFGGGDFWLVKTDGGGNMEWNKTYGGAGDDVAWSVQQTRDGGYIMAGHTTSFGAGHDDFWLVKTDADGNMEWNRTYGGPIYEKAYSVQQTRDGGYIVAGYTCSFGAGGYDFWLIKLGPPPIATINSPTDGAMFALGETITFSGTGIDTEGGVIPDSSYVWNSSIDGYIGTGKSINVSTLSVGDHVITLTVTDLDGDVGQDQVAILIIRPAFPFRRCTFVYSDPTSYLDEYAFLASVPANVFRDEAENVYVAPIIYGESVAGNYLLEDWKTYCDHWGGVSYIDFVGPYSSDYMSHMKGYLGTNNYSSIMVNDPYKYGKEIALREWINSTSAVLAPAKTYFPTPAATYGEFHGEFFNITDEYYTSSKFGYVVPTPPPGTLENIAPPIESPHPYENNMHEGYLLELTGAAYMSIHFPIIDVETGYDRLVIYDGDWNVRASYTGHYEDVWTPLVPGERVYVILYSDSKITWWGYIADALVWSSTFSIPAPPEFVIHAGEWMNFTVPANIPGFMRININLINHTSAVGETRLACFLIDPDGKVVDYDFTPELGDYTWAMWDINERPRTTTENYTVAIYCMGFGGGEGYGLVVSGLLKGYSSKPGNLDAYTITVPENARELDVWLSCNSTKRDMSWLSMSLIDPKGHVLFPNYYEYPYTEYPQSPEYLSSKGHLNTPHPTPGNWTLIIEASLFRYYPLNQTVEYTVQYEIASYNEEKSDYTEAATNGAVVASLSNAPLLYTANDTLPEETKETLEILGVKEVIFVDPAGIISDTVKNQVTNMNITIAQDLLSIEDIVSYIRELSGETDIVLTVPTNNFFAPAALAGAFHGAPVLTFEGSAKEIPTLADSTWASQYYHEFYGSGLDWLLKAPPIHWMHELSREWSEWIEGLGADTAGMESVLTVAPLVDVKPVFERAIQGTAKAGRIPGENAEEDVAFVNRAMLYPAIIYANPGYNVTMPTCVSYDYGMPDVASDIPPNLVQPPDYVPPTDYVYSVNGWDNTMNAMESRGFTPEPHVGKYTVFDKLNSGVAFWYHSNHGGLGFVWDNLPFGQGVVGLWYEDPPDPQPKRGYEYNPTTYAEDATVPDQYDLNLNPGQDGAVFQKLGEPLTYAYGGEFDRWLGNVHSAHVVFMDCYVGGSLLPLTMMRHGAASAIGDMRTGLLVDTDWFCVKYTQEVMAGRTLGQAFVTAVTKAGYVYPNTYFEMTLFSPAKVPDLPWTAYPYVDDCSNAYVFYGDPDTVLVDPTAAEPEALDPTEIVIVGHDPEQVVHNVGIAGLKPSKTVVGQGSSVSINVTVENQGIITETVDVTVFHNPNIIQTETVALTSGASKTLTFTWNTTGVAKGNYTITAKAAPVPGETDIIDNSLTDDWIFVTILGDIDGDFRVSHKDLFSLAAAYGSEPGDPNWNPNADINGDGKVGYKDLFILAAYYGKKYP